MKLSYIALAAGLLGSTAPAYAQGNPNPAARVLLDQANYWRAQNQPDKAQAALRRLLLLEPSNPDALALQAELAASTGDRATAQASLKALKRVVPDGPQVNEVEQALQAQAIDPAALNEARQLAAAGKGGEAVRAYQHLFHGRPPPPSLANEYYQTLAGTAGGWNDARSGLESVVSSNPNDLQGQLAYARTLTYREATRQDGIGRLASLAKYPPIASAAEAAWRQALLWLPDDKASVPALQSFAAEHPDDSAVAAKLQEAQAPKANPTDPAAAKRADGFAALDANRLSDAETAFQAALTQKPDDSDALGGLGLTRLKQHRDAEAKQLLTQAIAADPAHRSRWEPALQGAGVGDDYAQARALVARGDLPAAEHQLRMIIARGGEVTGAQSMLAQVAERRGDWPAAEAAFRAVLSSQPGNADAMVGLAGVLRRRGQDGEADALLARAETSGRSGLVERMRADSLRQQATQVSDPAQKIPLLRGALASRPNDPWISLDLARALAASGRAGEARATMESLVADTRPSVDALRAAALFAAEDNHPDVAAGLVGRLPPAARSADMKALLAQSKVQASVQSALGLMAVSPAAGREKLLTLAAQPDPQGTIGVTVAKAFLQMQNPAGAREALATAQAATPNPTPAQRIAYAGILLQAGDERGAQMVLGSLGDTRGLTTQQATALNQLRAGVAVRHADELNADGRQADAYDVLAPALQRDPDNPALVMAVARLYSSADQPRKAAALNASLLARDPGNLDARRGTVEAAIQAHDWAQARHLVQDAIVIAPDDPRTWIMAAELHRALGDSRGALADLRRARDLRAQQLGVDTSFGSGFRRGPGNGGEIVAEAPMAEGDTSSLTASGNPFRTSGSGLINEVSGTSSGLSQGDPMAADITRQMTALQDDMAPRVSLGVGYRSRTGTSGLDRLDEITAPATLVSTPFGSGKVTVTATPTFLSSGEVPLDATSQAGFGTGALGGHARPPSQYASGVGLSGRYENDWFAVDAGSTPLGFQQQNVLGGVEVAPEIADGVRLRITGERRAVTDSVLSYAGTRDPGTGEEWGGVTRMHGHGQIELSKGLLNTYAGGGYAVLEGKNVEQNHEYEFGAGTSMHIWHQGNDTLRLGLDLVYFGYDKNLRYFSLGQGGYFSPQSYFAALIPLRYSSKSATLDWSVGGSVGYQTYHENASAVFPNDPGLQSALEAQAGSNPTVPAFYSGKSASGIVGGAEGSVEYRVDPNIRIGTSATYQHAGDWSEFKALLYARYLFMGGL